MSKGGIVDTVINSSDEIDINSSIIKQSISSRKYSSVKPANMD